MNFLTQYLQLHGLSVQSFLLLGFLVGLANFVDSIAGGGGLISLPAYMIVGLPPKIASGTNKLSAGMGACTSFIRYARAGYVKYKIAIPCVIMGLIGSTIGATFLNIISESVLKMMMVIVLPVVLIFVIKKKTFDDENTVEEIDKKTMLKCLVITLLIGIYDGLYGPGTGTFLIILFTSVAKLKLQDANGVAKSINFATNMGALVTNLLNGNVLILLALACGVFSIIGGLIGTKLFKQKGSFIVKPIMVLVLLLFIVKVVLELVGK